MKKKEDTNEGPAAGNSGAVRNPRGRPAGSTNRAPVDSLALTLQEILTILTDKVPYSAEPADAVVKEPKPQGGNGSRIVSGRIYVPASWIGKQTITILLSDRQAATLKAMSKRKELEELLKEAADSE